MLALAYVGVALSTPLPDLPLPDLLPYLTAQAGSDAAQADTAQVNRAARCPQWASAGECVNNPLAVMKECPDSCEVRESAEV